MTNQLTKAIERAENFVMDWYEPTVPVVPHIDNYTAFAAFAGSLSSAFSDITHKEAFYSRSMSSQVETAGINPSTSEIVFPTASLLEGYYKLFNIEGLDNPQYVALAGFLSSHVHEVAHAAYSKLAFELLNNHNDGDDTWATEIRLESGGVVENGFNNTSLISDLVNIIEDVRINHLIFRKFKGTSIGQILEIGTSLRFNETLIEEVLTAKDSIETRLNAYLFYKRADVEAEDIDQLNARFPQLKSAYTISCTYATIESRHQLKMFIKEVSSALFDGLVATKEERNEAAQGVTGKAGEPGDDAMYLPENDMTKQQQQELDELSKEQAGELAEMEEEFNTAQIKQSMELESEVVKGSTNNVKAQFHYAKKNRFSAGNEPLPDVKLDAEFIRKLQELRSMNRAYGEIRTSGTKLMKHRLSRISTDGRMFSRTSLQDTKRNEVELIILLDLSGSMTWKPSSQTWNVLSTVVANTKKIVEALKKTDIRFSVLGHTDCRQTTGPFVKGDAMLYHLIDRTTPNLDEAFQKVMAVPNGNNYDDVMIDKCVELFQSDSDRKVLLVLSDGAPCGFGYDGEEATTKAAAKARTAGVHTYSISLVAGVVKKNNAIYGEEYNLNGSTPESFKKEFERKIIAELEKEVMH